MTVGERRARVLSGTAAYAAAAVAQRAIGFVLLPAYTRVLTPAEYGQIGVLMTLAAAAATVLSFGLETAVFRTCVRLRSRPADLASFVSTVGGFAIAAPLVGAAVGTLLVGPPLADAYDVEIAAIAMGFIGAAFLTSATVFPLAVLRAQERLSDYLRLTGVQVVLSVGMTVLLVVVFRWGVFGWMAAFAVASAALLGRGVLVLGHTWTAKWDARYLAGALAFGLPLIPHSLAHWGLSLSDRVVLGALVESSEVGVYYVAYLFGLPISLLAVALSQAVQPLYARASLGGEHDRAIAKSASDQILACGAATMAVATLGPPAIRAFLPPEYGAAAAYVPWIALGYGLYALYFVPMNAVTVLSGNTRWVWLVTVVAAAVNIGLNLYFVPLIGATAAAINTAVGYAILVIGVSLYMVRVAESPLRLDVRRILLGAVILAGGTAAATAVAPQSAMAQLVIRGAVVTVAAGLTMLVGTAPASTRLWSRAWRPRR